MGDLLSYSKKEKKNYLSLLLHSKKGKKDDYPQQELLL